MEKQEKEINEENVKIKRFKDNTFFIEVNLSKKKQKQLEESVKVTSNVLAPC